MSVIVGIILVAAILFKIEASPLIRKKLKKETWVFSILLLFVVGLSIIYSLDIPIPNPTKGLAVIFKPLSDLLFEKLLK
ncbi:putative membrane protein [Bacillus pakistanensis]|uniref:Membrane protein n=1 Tax=Rossellomorea pakistanensis TaxID=992288 RepID=A0ABS2N706_9BACI|nr:hypothetical protein [Bacillus pakistanensis]MBM7583638.1 putative membrane protein [Bacillus pakistanensis]